MSSDNHPSSIHLFCALPEEMDSLRRALGNLPLAWTLIGVGLKRLDVLPMQKISKARLIIVTGCCGGLALGSAIGQLAIPKKIISLQGERVAVFCPDHDLSERAFTMAKSLHLDCADEPLFSTDCSLKTAKDKKGIHQKFGANFVDMESAAVGYLANRLNVPYLVIRAVLDTADEDLTEPKTNSRLATSTLPPLLTNFSVPNPSAQVTLNCLRSRWKKISPQLAHCLSEFINSIC